MCAVGWWMWYVPMAGATLLAYVYARWTHRARGPQQPADTVQAYERFRQAMATPVPAPPPQRSPQSLRQRIVSSRH
jgi:hypothetical protein